jgi:hypothetical protein
MIDGRGIKNRMVNERQIKKTKLVVKFICAGCNRVFYFGDADSRVDERGHCMECHKKLERGE